MSYQPPPPPPPPPPGSGYGSGEPSWPPAGPPEPQQRRRPKALPLAIVIALVVAAVGTGAYLLTRDGDSPGAQPSAGATSDGPATGGPTTTAPAAEACGPVEHPADLGTAHLEPGDPLPEYSSDPPTSGPHSPTPTEAGIFYDAEQPVPELIHAMEHGAVVFWTTGLSEAEDTEFRDTVNAAFSDGYSSLIGVPYPSLDGKVAMTAWGTLQVCDEVDPEAIEAFVAAYYASGGEGALACADEASLVLDACRRWFDPPSTGSA